MIIIPPEASLAVLKNSDHMLTSLGRTFASREGDILAHITSLAERGHLNLYQGETADPWITSPNSFIEKRELSHEEMFTSLLQELELSQLAFELI